MPIYCKQTQHIRALMILQKKLTGMTHAALAAEFNISEFTVARELARALKTDTVAKFETELLRDLVPGAIIAVKTAMTNGNANVAIEILKGAGLLKKQVEQSSGGTESGDELDIHIRAKRRNNPSFAANYPQPLPQIRPIPALEASPSQIAQGLLPPDGLDRLPVVERVVADTPDAIGLLRELDDSVEGELLGADY